MLTLAVPLNLVIITAVWQLAENASEIRRVNLLSTARYIAAATDAELGEYITLARALGGSPALLDNRLEIFEAEARRAFAPIPHAWILIADPTGQQLINTARPRGPPLPLRNPAAIAAQTQALETRSITVTGVLTDPDTKVRIVTIEVPVLKDGMPFRVLAVSVKTEEFSKLLNNQQMPEYWLTGILDRHGRIIAGLPSQGLNQLADEGYQKIKDKDGVLTFSSAGGERFVAANAHSKASGWSVAVAVPRARLQAAAWNTIRWATILGGGLSVLSLLIAGGISRCIARPIAKLQESAATLLSGLEPLPLSGPPEIRELWQALVQAAAERKRYDLLRESEQSLRQLGDSLPDSAVYRFTHCPDGTPRFLYMSAGGQQLNGVLAEDVLRDANVLLGQVLPEYQERLGQALRRSAGGLCDLKIEVPMRRADGQVRWMRLKSRPKKMADGQVVWDGVQTDITEQKQAEEELVRQQRLTRLICDRAAEAIFLTDSEGSITYANPESQHLFGFRIDEMIGHDLHDRVHHHYADGFPRDNCPLSKILARGETVRSYEDVFFRKDGSPVAVAYSFAPLEQEGEYGGAVFVIRDISAQQLAQAALRESEERYRSIVVTALDAIIVIDEHGGIQSINPAGESMLGYTSADLLGNNVSVLMPEPHRSAHDSYILAYLKTGHAKIIGIGREVEGQRKDGSRFPAELAVTEWYAGGRRYFTGTLHDIRERKRFEEQIHLLMSEVNHRAKNLLTVVQTIARQTAATKPDDFIERFGERIHALALGQDLLVKNEWRGVDLHELVHSQLAHFKDLIGVRIELRGPSLNISAAAAQTLGMALHELATNAGKYGALSNADGRVEVSWRVECAETGVKTFTMTWREQGGPPVVVPAKNGFG